MDDSETEAEDVNDFDPMDLWTPWGMPRREASDDEDGSSEGDDSDVRTNWRVFTGFDDDVDSAGRAPEEEDVLYFSELDDIARGKRVLSLGTEENESFSQEEEEFDQDREEVVEALEVAKNREEEEKIKELEAITVPTGAFYMHDDRFQSAHSRQR